MDDAVGRLMEMMSDIETNELDGYNLGKISDYQDGTIKRTVKVMAGMGLETQRDRQYYRRHVSKAKYE